MNVKKELFLQGLNCENCAGIIREKVSQLEGVNSAKINLDDKILSIEINDEDVWNNILMTTKNIIKDKEPHVVVTER
ncbi:heavy metal-associated domain-containing protein [Clostridium sp. YIM B02506]|uniref:heavy-metal-associated domain-containing protein n=1 Tax=Clostridium sp. YIM B02506 TaxID=2910680 RepID=UPI001EEF53EB|nr:heavy metal-associated domain-containing protein [Clostridium sp. YIM B02506]